MLLQRQRPARFFGSWCWPSSITGAVAGRADADRDRAQLLRRASGGRDRRRHPPPAVSRHHHSRRRARARRGRHAGRRARPSRSPTIISAGRSRRRSKRRAARAAASIASRSSASAPAAWPATSATASAGRSSRSIRRSMRLARDRKIVPLPLGLRAGRADRPRRCAADARGVVRALRPDRARCVLLRCHPGASADARGFAGYLTRLAPHGVIVVHVSNRHMELASVVAAVGAAEGLVAYLQAGRPGQRFPEGLSRQRRSRGAGEIGCRPRRPAAAPRLAAASSRARRRRMDRRLFRRAARDPAQDVGPLSLPRAARGLLSSALRTTGGEGHQNETANLDVPVCRAGCVCRGAGASPAISVAAGDHRRAVRRRRRLRPAGAAGGAEARGAARQAVHHREPAGRRHDARGDAVGARGAGRLHADAGHQLDHGHQRDDAARSCPTSRSRISCRSRCCRRRRSSWWSTRIRR